MNRDCAYWIVDLDLVEAKDREDNDNATDETDDKCEDCLLYTSDAADE